MADFKYKISVVIPVYNCEEYLEACAASLDEQTMDKNDYQIVLVNDGSSDKSAEICEKLARERDNITYYLKENGGVSSARNKGMELSEGKYILFLDADDTLSNDTLETVYSFFEEHYEETDMVTYKIIPYWKESRYPLHYRFKILKESGVYDLNDSKYCFIAQTTMNICIKNENKVLFDTTLKFHEDQKFCYDVLREKMTIGYCDGPQYFYLRHPESTTKRTSYAYYLFEPTMDMWEAMFAEYDEVPLYLQSLFINDIIWKSLRDILLPYHYPKEEFDAAVERIVALLKRVDDEVILNRPTTDVYHKHYLLNLKGCNDIFCVCNQNGFSLIKTECRNKDGELCEKVLYRKKKMTAIINSFKVFGDTLNIDGFLKSPIFPYYAIKPELYLVTDGKREPIELEHSEHEHYKSNVRDAVFWRFRVNINVSEVKRFKFEIALDDITYEVTYYFNDHTPFKRDKKRKMFFKDGRCYVAKNNEFFIRSGILRNNIIYKLFILLLESIYYLKVNPGIFYYRAKALLAKQKKERIWVYLDRYGVFDNAYDQFKHDIKIKDGIKRYYILNECDWDMLEEKFEPDERANVVKFRSDKHKMLYFTCEKMITSFSNLSNLCPFGPSAMKWYDDLAQHEIIYLQHGLLHATLKNMYAKERCVIDKVVVSSGFEIKNFTENYGYADNDLIKAGMPRYDFMHTGTPKKNRIVFSPSWRVNLIGPLVNSSREEKREDFLDSEFYKEVSNVLNSDRLHKLLEENDLYLDFRNHPIFKCYNDLFETKSDRICLGDFETNMDEYKLMITDYSSIVFDSVYLNCPVIYFVPDYDKFRAGISHGYRKLDLPLEEGFGPLTLNAEDLLDELEKCIKNNFEPAEPYKSRMDGFFLYKDNDCRSRIYQAIK